MNFKTGDTLGGYTLLAECGKGAYGSVFLAENILTKQQFALKVISHSGSNYERELKGLQQYQSICRHSDLLQIYHVETKENFLYYTMDAADNYNPAGEYLPDTLTARLKNSGRLAPETVRQMAQELLADLSYLHSKGLFHRDIKPDNILWINGKATLGDIGLVTDTQNTVLAGTPGFIPAEVLAGIREFEAKDDFYALGKTIYCAVTGLPVNQYPEFPENGTLTGNGELIRLYNKLCAGEKADFISAAGQKRKNYKKGTWLMGLLFAAAAAVILSLFSGMRQPAVSVQPPVTKVKSAEIPLKPYVPSKEMMALLPRVRKYYQTVMQEMQTSTSNAMRNGITPEDIAKAEKYLEQNPTHVLAAYPQSLAIMLKQEEIQEQFAEKYKHEPVMEYFNNNIEIYAHKEAVEGKARVWRHSVEDSRKKLAELYKRQYELEYHILKKHKKTSYPE